jgi:hypothetical protein
MENIPSYIGIVFELTTALTVFFFYKASKDSKVVLAVLLIWLLILGVVSKTGFYAVTDVMPPRLLFVVMPAFVTIAALFLTDIGRRFLDDLDLKTLTWLHIVRIPVEIVLLWLFLYKMIPELMTFEGRNFDILSGITAPLIVYWVYSKKNVHSKLFLWWNILCLGLLLNIVTSAILAAPYPFQQLAFDQPNIGVLYFPFVWLPGCIVPLVFLSHLVAIRRVVKKKNI